MSNDSIQNDDTKQKTNKFADELIDLRDVNQQFTSQLKVEKFGIQRINDSVIGFVFQLDPSTSEATVAKYSYGVKGFYSESPKPYRSSSSPNMETIKNEKYIILRNKVNITYFDSLDVYIYKRKNWKESGRLGGIKIKDILIKNENE